MNDDVGDTIAVQGAAGGGGGGGGGAREKVLNDVDSICQIFSFLGGRSQYKKNGSFTTLEEAGRLYGLLSLVCKDWKKICDENLAIIVGPLKLEKEQIDLLCRGQRSPLGWTTYDFDMKEFVSKFCQKFSADNHHHPLTIGCIDMKELQFKQQMDVLVQILSYCNLCKLKKATITYCKNHHSFDEATFCSRDDSITHHKKKTMQLQAQVMDKLSVCPELEELDIALFVCGQRNNDKRMSPQLCYDSLMEHHLFSSPTIRHLHLSIFGIDPVGYFYVLNHATALQHSITTLDLNKFIIDTLPNLTHLKLSGKTHVLRDPPPPLIRISSKTLQVLDVSCLENTIVFCDCPQLQAFITNAHSGSGSLPARIDTRTQYNLATESFVISINTDNKFQALAVEVPFVSVIVPDTCQITIHEWGYWGGYRHREKGYVGFQNRLQWVRRCHLSSLEEEP